MTFSALNIIILKDVYKDNLVFNSLMNKTQRKLFALFFVLLFMLVAPTVVLFAQGYRFNWENNIFVYSGSITVKSWPRDIEIYIDGKKQDSKNLNLINRAYTINGIKPGKYRLTCSRPGFTSWEKEINVHSGLTTEFWNVILFPNEENRETEVFEFDQENITQFFLSPNKNDELILFANKENSNRVETLNTKNQEREILFETDLYSFVEKESGLNIEWNAENKKFILPVVDQNEKEDYLIVNTEDESFLILSDFFDENKIKKARWMFDEKNQLLVLNDKNQLFNFNYQEETTELIAENVGDYDFADYNIYYTRLPNNFVWEIKQSDLENKKQITSEIIKSDKENFIKITAYDKHRIFLSDKNNNLVFIEDKEKGEILNIKPTEKITGVQFSNDGKKLLCWNENEIWYYMLKDWEVQPKRYLGDKITIARSSETIKNVQWLDNYENIVLSTGNKIRSFEADPRNKTNISNLKTTDQNLEEKDLIYNKSNQTAYYLDNNKIFSTLLIDNSGFLGF